MIKIANKMALLALRANYLRDMGFQKEAGFLDNIKDIIAANPEAAASALIGSGVGAVGGAMLPPSNGEKKTKKRILKNLLTGAAVGGLAGGGLGAASSALRTSINPAIDFDRATETIVSKLPRSGSTVKKLYDILKKKIAANPDAVNLNMEAVDKRLDNELTPELIQFLSQKLGS